MTLRPPSAPEQLEERRAALGLPPSAAELHLLEAGDIVPYGPERGTDPLLQWPGP